MEPPLKYGPLRVCPLTRWKRGHCLAGSLTGVVASKSVTEASKGSLGPIGNRPVSAMAEGSLTRHIPGLEKVPRVRLFAY